jgi:hypothetical protein
VIGRKRGQHRLLQRAGVLGAADRLATAGDGAAMLGDELAGVR